jgi:hypothetical protein
LRILFAAARSQEVAAFLWGFSLAINGSRVEKEYPKKKKKRGGNSKKKQDTVRFKQKKKHRHGAGET